MPRTSAAASGSRTGSVSTAWLPCRACRRGSQVARRPNWIVNAWNSGALDVLDYQWSVAEEFWAKIDREAASST